MKKNALIFLAIACLEQSLVAQNIGIGTTTPNPSALLELQSVNKGFLIPRVVLLSETDVSTIFNPTISMLCYNLYTGLPYGAGFYYWTGTKWTKLLARDGLNLDNIAWGLQGNGGTTSTNFIGTLDNAPIVFRTFNTLSGKLDHILENASWGKNAGFSITNGTKNYLGGVDAGYLLTTGERNTFIGYHAGRLTDSASDNIAIGNEAFGSPTNDNFLGYYIAIGDHAGYNARGDSPFAGEGSHAGIYIGTSAGFHGPSGIAIGYRASFEFSDYRNIAIGLQAMESNTEGVLDIGIGLNALQLNTTGMYNLAVGQFALSINTTGEHNVGIGNNALAHNTTGNNNTALGASAGPPFGTTNLNNTTAIGNNAVVTTSNTMVFGDISVDRWAFGITTTSLQHALEVGVNAGDGNGAYLTQGGVWTNTSSRSKKEDFSEINGTDLLQKLKALRVQKWKYINSEEYHIGPVSEDFYDLFGLGTDDKGISTVDPAGISLAAIKELIKQTEELIKENESMRNEMKNMKVEIAQLKKGIK